MKNDDLSPEMEWLDTGAEESDAMDDVSEAEEMGASPRGKQSLNPRRARSGYNLRRKALTIEILPLSTIGVLMGKRSTWKCGRGGFWCQGGHWKERTGRRCWTWQ